MDFITQSLMAAGGVPLSGSWQSVNESTLLEDICTDGTYAYVCGVDYYVGTYIAKYQSNGELIWAKSIDYGASRIHIEGKSIAVDGNAIYFVSTPRDAYNAVIHKYDLDGNKIYEKTLQPSSFRKLTLNSISVCSTYFVCAGYMESGTLGSYDIVVNKYSLDGTRQWSKLYGTASADYCYDICIDSGNNSHIYLCGSTVYSSKTNALVVKTDSDGNILWSNATLHGSNGPDVANGISVVTHPVRGTIGFVVGSTYNSSTSKDEGLINYLDGTGVTATRRKIVESNGIVLTDVYAWHDPVGYQCRISGYIKTAVNKGFSCKYDDNAFYGGGKSFADATYSSKLLGSNGTLLAGYKGSYGVLFQGGDEIYDGVSATWGSLTMAVPSITDTTAATTVTTGLVSTTTIGLTETTLTTSQTYNHAASTSSCYNYSNKI